MPTNIDVNDFKINSEQEIIMCQNTYRLNSYNPLKVNCIDKIVKLTMIDYLQDVQYESANSSLCSKIAMDICQQIQKLNFDRYKIIVNVSIVEKASQSLYTLCGFLWDQDRDNCSTFIFENHSLLAYCNAFGIYYE